MQFLTLHETPVENRGFFCDIKNNVPQNAFYKNYGKGLIVNDLLPLPFLRMHFLL